MWRKLSLRARINCLIGLVLTLGLAANVARLVLEAGPRVQAEDQSVIRLTRHVIESVLPGVSTTPNANERVDKIVADLNRLRHVTIVRADEGLATAPSQGGEKSDDNAISPPSWFITLIHPERISVSVPVLIGGKLQTLVITSHPNDEMQEIWDGIVTQLTLGLVVAAVLFVVTSFVVRHALAPLDALSRAMIDIEAGRYRARVVPSGAPALAALCDNVNQLAATLDDALEDRRKLAERMVSLQDLERKDLARELHDEFGPHLFAIRAHAGAVMRLADREPSAISNLSRYGTAILVQVEALQQFNRRVLERLRPAGLVDLGLPGAIDMLIRYWGETNPEVIIDSRISPKLGRLGEAAELTAYRVVQEALTNTFRHAQATQVSVMIARIGGQPCAPEREAVFVRICDNGCGIDPQRDLGFGLIGMRERVWALGGVLTVASTSDGLVIEATFPIEKPPEEKTVASGREFVPALPGQ